MDYPQAARVVGDIVLHSVLHGISPHSTAVLVAVFLVVCSAAAFASYVPVRRAMAVDPDVILRNV
jgi:ABC-type lipoprotein release transport system permease subunit